MMSSVLICIILDIIVDLWLNEAYGLNQSITLFILIFIPKRLHLVLMQANSYDILLAICCVLYLGGCYW